MAVRVSESHGLAGTTGDFLGIVSLRLRSCNEVGWKVKVNTITTSLLKTEFCKPAPHPHHCSRRVWTPRRVWRRV